MKSKQEYIKTVILNSIQDLQRLPLSLLNNIRGRSRIKYGMTSLCNNGGFTLIELLVVVLIIGILAAVAVPQYQKAVEKSKATQALSLLKSTWNASQVYYQNSGRWPALFQKLDIDIPWNNNTAYIGTDPNSKSNDDWSLQLTTAGSGGEGVWVGRISGPYAGGGFTIMKTPYFEDVPANTLLCVEGKENNAVSFPFKKSKGSYCQKIFNATEIPLGHANHYFRL